MKKKKLFFKNQIVISSNYFSDYEFVFSFTKRVATATKCVRIRRNNDDAETDILLENTGPVNINSLVLAGGTLANWIGANNGFMVIDYDQMENGFDMAQFTNSKQAQIVQNGVWLGYKQYDGSDDIYSSTNISLMNMGSVYVKANKSTNDVLYYLSQAQKSNNKTLTFTTQYEAPNNKLRILDFTPSFNQPLGNNFMNVGLNTMMYASTGTNYKMRLNGVNQVISGTNTGNWFFDYSSTGFTLQKGGLYWNHETLFRNYREYEILGFNVTHTDAQSLEIENTM